VKFPTQLVRRLVLMIGGEAMQSGFHFALNIALLHMLSAQGYGLFAIGMVMGGVACPTSGRSPPSPPRYG